MRPVVHVVFKYDGRVRVVGCGGENVDGPKSGWWQLVWPFLLLLVLIFANTAT